MYEALRKLNYHVISFDYRCFGDSTRTVFDEEDLVKDGLSVYEYVKSKSGDLPVFIWCHSLGTGIGLRTVPLMC